MAVLQRYPIRWRLAAISAALTFVILCGFAYIIGELTARTIRADFTNQVIATSDELQGRLQTVVDFDAGTVTVTPSLDLYAAPDRAAIRIVGQSGTVLQQTRRAPDLGFPQTGTVDVNGYRVSTRQVRVRPVGFAYVQYGRRLSDVDATVQRVRVFLLLGVFFGTGLALAAGLVLARRAMAPIAALTATTREIARTRDPNRRVPVPDTDDEVAELARTLEEMLVALESSRAESAAMLARQRQFVADASHELRTPLTAVLANLELLAETLEGEHGEAAQSALRSSRRMRRLVADLLLLARQDGALTVTRGPVDLQQVAVEAAGELGTVAESHELVLHTEPVVVSGARDELLRLVLNLVENAIKHTPPGTAVTVCVERSNGQAVLSVFDDGPGIPEALRARLFERFVRGEGDRGGSFGLGLSIVRAVARAHGGDVELAAPDPDKPGARFVVRLPAVVAPLPAPAHV